MSNLASRIAELRRQFESRQSPAAEVQKPENPPATPDKTGDCKLHRTVQVKGNLAEMFRPKTISDVLGQEHVTSWLKSFVASPYPRALLFSGPSGTGKTSAALALANDLGAHDVMSGLDVIASGEQSADAVRNCIEKMSLYPMCGDWRVTVVNECDRMSKQAETIWLDALENLPGHAVIVFTTNEPGSLSERFRDRCQHFEFEGGAQKIMGAAVRYARKLADSLGVPNDSANNGILEALVRRCVNESGMVSFRRVASAVQAG